MSNNKENRKKKNYKNNSLNLRMSIGIKLTLNYQWE